MYKVLCLDGGGIAGLFSARIVERLSAEFSRLLPGADFLAETSTGGIIALALADGKTPSELVSFYTLRGPEIFSTSAWDRIRHLGNALGARYDNKALKDILSSTIKAKKLGDFKKRILIPTFDLDAAATADRPRMGKPKFFHNFPGPRNDCDASPVDVAMRTSAAPTYFPAYRSFIDGGVGVAEYQCERVLGGRYHRVNRYLSKVSSLDDASPENLAYLHSEASKVELKRTFDWLKKFWR